MGIIQNIKVHYKKLFLQYLLAKINEFDAATNVATSVNILVAIRWVAKAWLEVKEETICKCFVRLVYWISLDAVSLEEEDPSSAADESMITLQGLIDKTMSGSKSCTLEEYMNRNDIVPV